MSAPPLRAIGDVVEPVFSWTPERDDPEGVFTYVDLSAVDQETKAVSEARELACSEAPSRARQLIRTGDVLVATVRPNLNGVAHVPPELDGATASTGFCVLRPRATQLDGRYLYHWVKSRSFVSDMVWKATGASYPAVSDRIVRESMVPLPPALEQRRIAEILDKADALRANRRTALAQLGTLTPSIFFDMFGDPATDTKSWPTMPLAALVRCDDTVNYGVVQPGEDIEGGVPIIRVGDFANGEVSHLNMKRIAPLVDKKYKRSRLRGDEILVSCVGSIGIVAIADDSLRGFNIARAVARVPVADTVDRVFLAAYLRTDHVQRYFTRELRTVSQPTLNIKQLAETKIVLPPKDVQQEFAQRAGIVEALRTEYRSSLKQLDALVASLQHRAFRGEL